MPAKKPAAARPQFDAEPIDDEEQPPFTLDDDGHMVLRRKADKPKEAKRGKVRPKPAQ